MAITAIGREEKLYVVPEVTFGTAVQPIATNACRFKGVTMAQQIDLAPRDDKRATRSLLEKIQRRKSASFSVSGYLLPAGALGVAPDGWDDLLKAGFGTQTINASTSVVYSMLKENTTSLCLHRALGHTMATAVFAETMRGAVVNQMQFSLSGQDEANVTISGMAKDILRAGVSAVVTDSSTSTVVTSGHGSKFDAGMFLDIDVATAVSITSVSTDTLTVASHAAQTAADPIVPSICTTSQTFVATAKPISGILGSVTLDGSSFNVVSAEIQVSNNVAMQNDTFGSDSATGFSLGNREVTGSITFRLTDANFLNVAKLKAFADATLNLVAGTTAGSIATFAMGKVRLDYAAISIQGMTDVMVTLPFQALGTSGEDELTLTLT